MRPSPNRMLRKAHSGAGQAASRYRRNARGGARRSTANARRSPQAPQQKRDLSRRPHPRPMGAGCAGGRGTIVVDVTYACNARCRYCRWGDGSGRRGSMQDPAAVMIPERTLRLLGAKRLVISGGEPTLHPGLGEIISHYAALVDEVVVITNGYSLSREGEEGVERLARAGATGVTFSVDSADPRESLRVRGTPPAVHAAVLGEIRRAAADTGMEIGVNATVTSATAGWPTAGGLLEFGRRAGVDFVKFQPVFDDGYASASAPDLLLSGADVPGLLDVAQRLEGRSAQPPTNPPGFWRDVAALASGRRLPASACSLDASDAIATGGTLSVCTWVGGSRYGSASSEIEAGAARAVQSRFAGEKARCAVGPHCFCNQGMDHVWAE